MALIITGYVILSFTSFLASDILLTIPVPLVSGTLLAMAVALAVALSPIFVIHSGLGPINVILCSSHIEANLAFSDKNPYPGCIASAPVISAAAIILGTFK